MIKGIGTDIIEIARINKYIQNKNFVNKIYTKEEQKLYNGNNPESLAGNFACKEAIVKAFGTGFKGCKPTEIEILRSNNGKPYVNLYSNANEIFKSMGCNSILVSISHNKDNAVAFAIIE